MANKKHQCPECKITMEEIPIQQFQADDWEFKTVDLGSTGHSGVTVASTLSGEVPLTSGYSGTSGYASMFGPKKVMLIPYQCPECGYKKSFRK